MIGETYTSEYAGYLLLFPIGQIPLNYDPCGTQVTILARICSYTARNVSASADGTMGSNTMPLPMPLLGGLII